MLVLMVSPVLYEALGEYFLGVFIFLGIPVILYLGSVAKQGLDARIGATAREMNSIVSEIEKKKANSHTESLDVNKLLRMNDRMLREVGSLKQRVREHEKHISWWREKYKSLENAFYESLASKKSDDGIVYFFEKGTWVRYCGECLKDNQYRQLACAEMYDSGTEWDGVFYECDYCGKRYHYDKIPFLQTPFHSA